MTTSELALEIVSLIGKASKLPNELGRFLNDFSNATIRWIRPLFLIDGAEDSDYSTYKNDPENPKNADSKDILIEKVKKALNNDAVMQNEFKELIKTMKEGGVSTSFVNNILGDKNTLIQGGSGNTITITN